MSAIWKTQQWPQDWKRSVFIPIPKKGNAQESSNYCTNALISHASKVIFKILQARLQQYVNHELPGVQDGFRTSRVTIYSLDILIFLWEPVCCSMSSSNCSFLTCIQVFQEADQVVWYSHLFQNFPQFIVIHTVKGFGVVNKAEIDVLLELSCFFDDPGDVGNLISGSSAFSKTSLNIWKFMVHVLLKPDLENFEHSFTSM